jgi:glycosyltransferase involved in cell wall biosynthesis
LTLFLNFDQVFCSSGPIINTLPLFAAYLKGRKKIVEVRDIWPEILQITSIKIPRFIYQAMLHYAKWIYQLSERVIVLNEDAKQYLVNYYHHCKNKLHVIPQLPIELFKKSDWDQSALKKWNLEKGKYAIYAGNIGEVNAVFDLLEHAEYVYARENEFKLVLVGEGKLLNQIKSDTAMGRYPFLVITGLLNKSSTYALMENAFCHFVWLKNDKILETSSPNKFAESLLLGVPVIINVGGWMENYIEKNNSGKRSYTKAQTLEIIQNMLDTTHLKTDLIKKSALEFFQAEKLKSSYIVYQ